MPNLGLILSGWDDAEPLQPPLPDDFIGPPAPGQAAGLHGALRFLTIAGQGYGQTLPFDDLPALGADTHDQQGPLSAIDRWLDAHADIRADDPIGQLHFLAPALTGWIQTVRQARHIKLKAQLALKLICDLRLHRQFCNPGKEPLFRSAHDFASAVLACWGFASEGSRVSHILAAAEFWLRLRAHGLPRPLSLDRLELLASRPDGLPIYIKLAKPEGDEGPALVPSSGAIRAHLNTLKPLSEVNTNSNAGEAELKLADRVIRDVDAMLEHLDQGPGGIDAIREILVELRFRSARLRDDEPAQPTSGRKRPAPPPRPNLAEGVRPFTLVAAPEHAIDVHVALPYREGWWDRYEKLALRHRWRQLPGTPRIWRVDLPTDSRSRLIADRGHLLALLTKLCDQMHLGHLTPELPPIQTQSES